MPPAPVGAWPKNLRLPGNYRAEICFGSSTVVSDHGTDVADLECIEQDFSYPTDTVLISVNRGG